MSKFASAFAVFLCFLLPGTAVRAFASEELDHRYALQTVGFLRAWDNVDGIFADPVAQAYGEYFSRQSRFILQDLSKADTVLTKSTLPYHDLIEDPAILAQVARVTRSQTLLRTEIRKEGGTYHFRIEWIHEPDAALLASERFEIAEPRDGRDLRESGLGGKLREALDRIVARIPWVATVTGRDNHSVTVDIGTETGLRPGDTLVVSSIDEAKVHPLLKEIVEWKLVPTGRLRVDQVASRMAFCHIEEEEPGRQVLREQKITQVLRAPPEVAKPAPPTAGASTTEADGDDGIRLGWLGFGLDPGQFSRTYSTQTAGQSRTGSGFMGGALVSGRIWLTPQWFADGSLGYYGWHYGGDFTQMSSGNAVNLNIAGGYSYLLNNDILGPKIWGKFGFRSSNFNYNESAAALTTPITFQSWYLGLGTDLPVRDGYWAFLNFDYGLFNTASESTNLSGTPQGGSNISLSLGGYYRYTPHITFKVTLDYDYQSEDFQSAPNGAALNPNISQTQISIVPAVLYYF